MKDIKRLPDAELDVMQALWQCQPPVPRAALEEKLGRRHPMAPTTLLTLLGRLADRGFLAAEKAGRSSVYRPLVSQEDYLAAQSRRFLDRLCGGSVSTLANALCDSGISKEDLAELRQLLERKEL